MPWNKTAVGDLGTIDAHGTEFRAHIQFRGDAGEKKHIYGPSRSRNEAQKDLGQIRVAGVVGATWEEGIKLMEAEAKHIKIISKHFLGRKQPRQPSRPAIKHAKRVNRPAIRIPYSHYSQ